MKREDLVIGQWYKAFDFSDQFYQFLGLTKNCIKASYVDGGRRFYENFEIGNSSFWSNCRKAEYSEYKQWLPEQYKTQHYEIY